MLCWSTTSAANAKYALSLCLYIRIYGGCDLQKPKVSSEGYTSLYDDTKAWISEKTEQSKAREFPNTVEEMRAALEKFESSVLKEMPGKKRDLSVLSELNDKLEGQKKTTLPPNYEYSKLAEVG